MMYKDKFVLAVKHDGKILREFKGQVYLPFGSEYSLYLKNLNSVRALARIWIDGQLVTDGVDLIVPANGHIDLERFIRNGNLNNGNKFKFIERSGAVEKFRGVGAEDGLIRIEFKFEKFQPVYHWTIIPCYHNIFTTGSGTPYRTINHDNTSISTKELISDCCESFSLNNSINCSNTSSEATLSKSVNEAGFTAAGSASAQKFAVGSWFPTEDETHVIVLKLLGQTEKAEVVQRPVTVKVAQKCTSCGRKNKATAKFCAECGTALYII